MVTIVVHLFVRPGMTKQFREYEIQALQILREYGGEILSIFQPKPEYSSEPCPDEIHVIRMASRERFQEFRHDTQLASLAELRAQAIAKTELFMSHEFDDNVLQ